MSPLIFFPYILHFLNFFPPGHFPSFSPHPFFYSFLSLPLSPLAYPGETCFPLRCQRVTANLVSSLRPLPSTSHSLLSLATHIPLSLPLTPPHLSSSLFLTLPSCISLTFNPRSSLHWFLDLSFSICFLHTFPFLFNGYFSLHPSLTSFSMFPFLIYPIQFPSPVSLVVPS